MKKTKKDLLSWLSTFERQYLETLLWSSTDDNGEPLDREFSIEDFTLPAIKECLKDCKAFQKDNADLLKQAGDDSQNGHDFALTRNGHGAGFWDRGYGEVGDKLSDACKPYGEVNPYSHKGKLYI